VKRILTPKVGSLLPKHTVGCPVCSKRFRRPIGDYKISAHKMPDVLNGLHGAGGSRQSKPATIHRARIIDSANVTAAIARMIAAIMKLALALRCRALSILSGS
jgi:hypothetical protein